MDEKPTENLVVRNFYLPLEMDQKLRELAFTRGIIQGDLVRDLIRRGLEEIAASGERSLAERLDERAAALRAARARVTFESLAEPATDRKPKAVPHARAAPRKPRGPVAAG